jgi:hypothetical protein
LRNSFQFEYVGRTWTSEYENENKEKDNGPQRGQKDEDGPQRGQKDDNDEKKDDEDDEKKDDDNEENKKTKKKSKNSLKCMVQEPEFIQLSKNNAKKLWNLEYEYIENNKDKYGEDKDKKQLKILKKIRNVKLSREEMELFGQEKKKPRSKNKINTMLDIGDELILSNRYNKYD